MHDETPSPFFGEMSVFGTLSDLMILDDAGRTVDVVGLTVETALVLYAARPNVLPANLAALGRGSCLFVLRNLSSGISALFKISVFFTTFTKFQA